MAHTMVIFGASGDLTSRKLIPALYRLFQRGRLPADTRVVGFSRSDYSDEQWREQLTATTTKYVGKDFDAQSWKEFSKFIHYCSGDIQTPADFEKLAHRLEQLEGDQTIDRVYYVATMPQLYEMAAQHLGQAGLADDSSGARRIVIEKPFGTDLKTARHLNQAIGKVFREDQVYRIDHYLGKETVQNIMVLRYGNSIFEPLWNRNYIDHVQITVAEEVVVGRRGDYYDGSGVLRDMFQNHIFQLMMVTAMEPPVKFNSDSVRDEKVKVLKAVRPMKGADFADCGVRGQYEGYRKEVGVAPDSPTETFAALKLHIDNWRWQGVPFYLRSGKALSCRTTQIVIEFKEPPHLLFGGGKHTAPQANRLVIQIQPAEGIQIHFQSKVPDADMSMRQSELDFRFDSGGTSLPDSYQRLLQDVLMGDASLFARSDEVESAWAIIDPIIAAWRSPAAPAMNSYPIESWGPEASTHWMQDSERNWFDVCPVIS
ncbi:glucose-6-phosphate dehydrogenase [Aureliella helgolandensis]|uniref:Glucose-6-phosphate 1-dehydrogenase n=1 Tax=Aureliella helgolandensis TaxID=2527968 RepID=A0A518G2N6_9BACT|nr:glucose-6-phosphate dehydrogenase [Aureliella helgolandensis]QDV22863.1 Glucose-6-phosphate 1-dehydrogenase [Aureliella helgolandensis]